MEELQVFQNPEFGQVRTIEIDGEPYFVGKDVADILGYQNGSRDVNRHVDEEDRQKIMVFDGNQDKETIIINESGLYSLTLSSKLPSAKRFKRWVTSEVLPSIRKSGGYNLPRTYSEALRALADQAEEMERLKIENKEMIPKAEFFDTVTDSKDAIEMKDVAKMLNIPGMGRNKLFEFLRNEKVLMSDNTPYQQYIDRGYFRVIEQRFDRGYGETGINIKTLVFQKGINFISKIWTRSHFDQLTIGVNEQ